MLLPFNWHIPLTTLTAALIAAGSAFLPLVSKPLEPGDTQWVSNIVSNQDIRMTAMSLSVSGEVFIAGTFHGSVDFDPSSSQKILTSGNSDAGFIAKYTPSGTLVWAGELAGSGDVHINDIVVDSTAQIGVVGSFEDTADLDPSDGVHHATSKGGHDIFVERLLPDGALQWVWTAGADKDDMAFGVVADEHQGLYVTGKYEGKADHINWNTNTAPVIKDGKSGSDVFITRFNNAGTNFWVDVLGGDEDDIGMDIGLDAKDNAYVVGTFSGDADLDPKYTHHEVTSRGHEDIFVVTVTLTGAPKDLSTWYMGGPGTEGNPKIQVESDGSYYVTGTFERNANFNAIDSTQSLISNGGSDLFIAYYGPSPAYRFQWAFNIGGIANDELGGITHDSSGNIYITGAFSASADFDPGPGDTQLTSSGQKDIFVAQYTSQMQFLQAQQMINPLNDRAGALAVAPTGNLIVGGDYSGSIDLGSGLSISSGQPDGVYSLFIVQYARSAWMPFGVRSSAQQVTPTDQ